MLKIKDSVDLKELESFGFDYNDYTGKYVLNLINKPLCIKTHGIENLIWKNTTF